MAKSDVRIVRRWLSYVETKASHLMRDEEGSNGPWTERKRRQPRCMKDMGKRLNQVTWSLYIGERVSIMEDGFTGYNVMNLREVIHE